MVSRLGSVCSSLPHGPDWAAKATGLIVLHVRLPLFIVLPNFDASPFHSLCCVCLCARCRLLYIVSVLVSVVHDAQIWLAIDTSAEMLEMLDCLHIFLCEKRRS